jgi:small-conductance mechanosensitive channel
VTLSFELLVLLTVPAASALLVVFVLWQHKRQNEEQVALSRQFALAQEQLQLLSAELEEIRAGLIGIGQRVLKVEQQQRALRQQVDEIVDSQLQLAEQQQKIDMFDPESKLYSRAMKMVQLGAPLEEVMRECELPRAEAELLYNLHKN